MALFRRILSLGTHASTDREIDAELREPMAMGIDDNMARGMSLEAAERDARRRFGNPTVMREHVSAEDAALGLESLWHDARSALRVFVKNPGFHSSWSPRLHWVLAPTGHYSSFSTPRRSLRRRGGRGCASCQSRPAINWIYSSRIGYESVG